MIPYVCMYEKKRQAKQKRPELFKELVRYMNLDCLSWNFDNAWLLKREII